MEVLFLTEIVDWRLFQFHSLRLLGPCTTRLERHFSKFDTDRIEGWLCEMVTCKSPAAYLVYGRYEHVLMSFLFLTAFGVLFFRKILSLDQVKSVKPLLSPSVWSFSSDKACSYCWARENTQLMTSAGKHVTGVTRGKNMQPVFCAGKHAIAVKRGKIRYSGKSGKAGKPSLQPLRVASKTARCYWSVCSLFFLFCHLYFRHHGCHLTNWRQFFMRLSFYWW